MYNEWPYIRLPFYAGNNVFNVPCRECCRLSSFSSLYWIISRCWWLWLRIYGNISSSPCEMKRVFMRQSHLKNSVYETPAVNGIVNKVVRKWNEKKVRSSILTTRLISHLWVGQFWIFPGWIVYLISNLLLRVDYSVIFFVFYVWARVSRVCLIRLFFLLQTSRNIHSYFLR